MNWIRYFLERRVTTLFLAFGLFVGGLQAYLNMSRLEDPEFTIKDALIITPYSGASAEEVEQEVSDEIEIAVQQLGQLDEVISKSERGLSTVTVTIKDTYGGAALPQVWDELRHKVHDAQSSLPPGAGPSMVIDDYGDVFGVFFVVYGADYSYAELKRVTDMLRRELLKVQDVGKVSVFGERREALYVEFNRDRLALLGISPESIGRELQNRNLVGGAGRVQVGDEFIAIHPDGEFKSLADIENLLIDTHQGGRFYLRDVAKVSRGYVDPRSEAVYYAGHPSIGLGISTVSGGNVVTMGEALLVRLEELKSEIPLGMEIGMVSMQSEAVQEAINGFVISLIEAVAIVIGVLLLFMGLRSGLLIGVVLILTIVGSFMILKPMGVALERVSLGALIIALGMLVDNAIVVVDGILVGLGRGKKAMEAAVEVVKQSAIPLLGATFIAVLAFAAIGFSKDSTGEFTRSLFLVILVSLLLSWVVAVTVTPLLGVMFLPKAEADGAEPHSNRIYGWYKSTLRFLLRNRWKTVMLVGLVFVLSLAGFTQLKQAFFPPSTRPQFLVDFWMPQGTHFDVTDEKSSELADFVRNMEGVEGVTTLVGQGGPRFLLTYVPEKPNAAYAQLIVDVSGPEVVDDLIPEIEAEIVERFPDALGFAYKFELGPGAVGKIQARFSGPDETVLREIANQAIAIMDEEPEARAPRTNWRQRVKVIRPILIEEQARHLGIDYLQVARLIRSSFQGQAVGLFREGDLLLPIMLRAPEAERLEVSELRSLQIWSPVAQRYVPLTQVVSDFQMESEEGIIVRKDRQRSITVFSDPRNITASELLERLRRKIEAIELPSGYNLEWEGEYKDTAKAQSSLAKSIPLFAVMMVLVTIALFNSIRQPLLIWACVPLATIGVTAGLLVTGQPFGFMALLGFLSLSGMLIKNAIVMIDEINLQMLEDKSEMDAVVDSATSRLMPVGMAATTTALGMIPLLFDAFFSAMAVTIVSGLVVATVLTMLVLPVFYVIGFNIKEER
ncbi:efflux RND transporter permease subunit [Pelagicoccus albus]|uniref:Efflux RND transporter permease subunit n=1 Tax=Pelagicoccus albus TaxID=415222 RepID=A0A7X1BB99_9BACT|nr:efflux RND transporter permease subunit [Pelagicoccus albus]MBC2607858.1 efflux RND transporter permease subunit [Pelagicoccus albus]